MNHKTRLLFWLLAASKGAITRLHILSLLKKSPMNARKLSLELNLDYKTIRNHLELLEKYQIIDAIGNKYGKLFFISSEYENEQYLLDLIKKINNKVVRNEKNK